MSLLRPCNSTSRNTAVHSCCYEQDTTLKTKLKHCTFRNRRRCGLRATSVPRPGEVAAFRASTLCSQSCRTPCGREMDAFSAVSHVWMASWSITLLRMVCWGTCTNEPSGSRKTTPSSTCVALKVSYSSCMAVRDRTLALETRQLRDTILSARDDACLLYTSPSPRD